MPTPNRLDRYPYEYFSLVERASREGRAELRFRNAAEASAARLQLYGFASAALRASHPIATFASNLTILSRPHPSGGWRLILLRIDNNPLAEAVRQQLPAAEPRLAPAPAAPPADEGLGDAMESALQKLGYFTHKEPHK